MNSLATEMNDQEIQDEITRLQKGKVGKGFRVEYIQKCIDFLKRELKSRKLKE